MKSEHISITDITQLLRLQERYARLEMECMRMFEYVQNLRDGNIGEGYKLIEFENEWLNDVACILHKSNVRFDTKDKID